MFDLSERVVVVTGASGNLGSALVGFLGESGAKVVALDLSISSDLRDLSTELANLKCFEVDILDSERLTKILTEMREVGWIPSVLLNCAGIDAPPGVKTNATGAFELTHPKVFEDMMRVNYLGVATACQVFGPIMAEHCDGSIINIGSLYASVVPDKALYEFKKLDVKSFINLLPMEPPKLPW